MAKLHRPVISCNISNLQVWHKGRCYRVCRYGEKLMAIGYKRGSRENFLREGSRLHTIILKLERRTLPMI
jgi:hypothetical protein